MKVAIIGGTGRLGRGLAVRLAEANEVSVGSRDGGRGVEMAEKLTAATGRKIYGGTNEKVAQACEVAVLALPSLEELSTLRELRSPLAGKMVISPVVPMQMKDGLFRYSKQTGSAAEDIASVLGESRVVAALHNLPARSLEVTTHRLDFDVLVACERKEDYDQASGLISSISGLRPIYVGPLAMSREIEGLTPLLLNAAKTSGLKRLSVKLVN